MMLAKMTATFHVQYIVVLYGEISAVSSASAAFLVSFSFHLPKRQKINCCSI